MHAHTGIALTRGVSRQIARCELTAKERVPIDPARAAAQHHAYEEALAGLGYRLIRLPAEESLPDCVFIEDTAVVLDELAVVTRPGAESRRPETTAVEAALGPLRPLAHIQPPGTLDGGDVLRVGRQIYAGCSARSNAEGRAQLRSLLAPFGYSVQDVLFRHCLHLKSAVTLVAENTLLIHPGWVTRDSFPGMSFIEVDPAEPDAANALLLAGTILYPAAFPATRKRLEERGLRALPLAMDELGKAEGGVTCCSLILREPPASR
jgi:dimethylargininase